MHGQPHIKCFNVCGQTQFSVSYYCPANVAACLPYLYHRNWWWLLERHSPSRPPRSGSSWASPELRLWVLTNWGQGSSGRGSWSSRDRCQLPQMSYWHLGTVRISVRTRTEVQSYQGHCFQRVTYNSVSQKHICNHKVHNPHCVYN